MTKVSPSLLSANFLTLDKEIEMLNESQADMIHLDVMDGVFVPNITFGFPLIKAVRKIAKKPLDVHLMIVNPDRYVEQVRDSGADIMNVHVETCTHLERLISQIKNAGMKAAVTLNPSTPLCMIEEVACDVDMILLMSVNPGFSGQKFIANSVDKTRRLREMLTRLGSKAEIQVDGGINELTGHEVVNVGADIVVAGNFVFSAENPKAAIEKLKNL